MAQEVHQNRKFGEQYLHRQSLAQLQPCLTYTPDASPTYQSVNFHIPARMAHSMVGSPYMQTQPWAMQHAEKEDVKPTAPATTTPSSNSLTYPSGQNWSGDYGTPFNWHHALQQAGTYIVPDLGSQFRQNHTLIYNPAPNVQDTMEKRPGGEPTTWLSYGLNELPRGVAADRSVLDVSMSPSSKSYVSDEFGNTYSPVSMLDQASPTDNWNRYPAIAPNAALSSPSCRSFHVQKIDSDVGLSGLPRTSPNMGMATVPSNDSSRQEPASAALFKDDQQLGSDYSHPQNSSAGHSSWYHADYSYDAPNVPFRSHDIAPYSDPSSDTSLCSTSGARHTQYRSAPWNESCPSIHTQGRVQDRFQVPRSAVAQAQREHNDQLLIEGKKKGQTYKEIKLKMVGEMPAESTLRGRYRSLTKARKDRVRKPIWTKVDLELLDEAVQQEFDRIESNLQNPYSLSFDQKVLKVAWKKVAESIADNGGSYHFGNATCKRRWLERNPGRK